MCRISRIFKCFSFFGLDASFFLIYYLITQTHLNFFINTLSLKKKTKKLYILLLIRLNRLSHNSQLSEERFFSLFLACINKLTVNLGYYYYK